MGLKSLMGPICLNIHVSDMVGLSNYGSYFHSYDITQLLFPFRISFLSEASVIQLTTTPPFSSWEITIRLGQMLPFENDHPTTPSTLDFQS